MSVPLKFAVGVYVYVPSILITIPPWFGPSTGVVFAVNVVPSGSKSPAFVKSPVAGVSSFVVMISSSTRGASLIGLTTMTTIDVSHNPFAPQEITQIVSFPEKLLAGVYVKHDVPTAGVITPLFGASQIEIATTGYDPKFVNVFVQIVFGVSSLVVTVIVSFLGLTVTVTVAKSHKTAGPLSHT